MKTRGVILVLCTVLLAGCGSFFIGLGLLISCGPMPMSASDCEGGRGWGFGSTKDESVCPVGVTQETAEMMRCVRSSESLRVER